MPKFKVGDYVTLREDARYPTDGSLWSTIDSNLIPGKIFKVSCLGRFSWNNFEQDCVGLDITCGWIPEICFDPVVIPEFKKGDIVECYRLPNFYDWSITSCGKVEHNLKVGEQYEVVHVSNRLNLEFKNDNHSYPPTIFRKVVPSVEELPEKWAVACKENQDDTPELKEWRNLDWTGEGYINCDGRWFFPDSVPSKYTKISYKTFLEKVYKTWLETQKKVEKEVKQKTSLSVLPERWAYSLINESADRLKLIEKWRLSVCEKIYRTYNLRNSNIICNHEDGSYFYTGGLSCYTNYRENVVEITKEDFDRLILQPWIDKSDSKNTQQETTKPLELLKKKIVTTVDVGARVVRGRDWDWENQDGSTVGTIISQSDLAGWVIVKWDNEYINSYRIGDCNKYDLYYSEDQTPASVTQHSISDVYTFTTSPHTTISYQSILSSTPHLVINKPKKRLFSTEVSELNVNLKLLKTN